MVAKQPFESRAQSGHLTVLATLRNLRIYLVHSDNLLRPKSSDFDYLVSGFLNRLTIGSLDLAYRRASGPFRLFR